MTRHSPGTHQAIATRFRPRVELLEDRTLLAFGLDFGFATNSPDSTFLPNMAVAAHPDGGMIVAGTLFSGSFDADPGPGTHIVSLTKPLFVAKYLDGSLVWAVTLSGQAYDMDVDAAGNIYVGGRFTGTRDFDPGAGVFMMSAASTDNYVLKLNSQGEFAWARQIGSPDLDVLYDLVVDSTGAVAAVGFFMDTIADLDPGPGVVTLENQGTRDGYIIQFNSDGDLAWTRRVGSPSTDSANGIAVDAAGNFYITGSVSGPADFGLNAYSGPSDGFLLKLDSAGNFVWSHSFGGAYSDGGGDIGVDGVGNIYVSGVMNIEGEYGEPGTGGDDINFFASKFDEAGNEIWTRSIGNQSNRVQSNTMAVDSIGNVYFGGLVMGTVDLDPGIGTVPFASAVYYSAFLTKLDPNGELTEYATWPTTTYSQVFDLDVDDLGQVYLSGIFKGEIDLDPGEGTLIVDGGPSSPQFYTSRFHPPPSVDLGSVLANEDDPPIEIDLATAFVAAGQSVSGSAYVVLSVSNKPLFFATSVVDEELTVNLAANAHGSSEILIAAQDSAGAWIYGQLTITIAPVPDLPSAADDAYQVDVGGLLTVGSELGLLANDEDMDGDPLQVIDYSEPSHGTVTVNANGSFTYQGTASAPATDSFTYTLQAGGDTTTAVVTIPAISINQAPVAESQSLQVDEDESLLITLSGTDQEPEVAQQLTFTILTPPSQGALSNFNSATGEITFTPYANYNGADSFTFFVTDDANAGGPALTSSPATVTIQVAARNDAPTANAQSLVMNEDGALAIALTGLDNDPEVVQPLRFTVVAGPSHGRLIEFDVVTGQYIYVPDLDFNGQDSFSFTATDGEAGDELISLPATVTITVDPLADTNQVVVRVNPDQPDSNELIISGSARNDRIVIKSDPDQPDFVHVKTNIPSLGTFTISQRISRVIVRGFEGSDTIIAKGITHQEVALHGGAGSDTLHGGALSDILLGEAGRDLLKAKAGRDLLIGGAGRDTITGGSGEDILIGGSTAFDTDAAALAAILAEWSADSDHATRIANLSGAGSGPSFDARLNGDCFLTVSSPATLLGDNSKDRLTGGGDLDWFFADGTGQSKDAIADRLSTETITRWV